jgi:alpha-L-fucosidase
VTRPRSLAAAVVLLFGAAATADDFGKVRRQLLEEADRVASLGPYKPDWESLKTVPIPEWYLDGKFGIFIHWGLYSVPAFGNEWYPRNMRPHLSSATT